MEHLSPCGDHSGILHKSAHKRRREETQDGCQHQGKGAQEAQAEPHQLPHLRPALGAVQIPEEGYAAEGEAGEHQLGDHVDLQHDAHGGDLIVAVGQQELVDHNDTQALHEIAQCCRHAHAQDLTQLPAADMAERWVDG